MPISASSVGSLTCRRCSRRSTSSQTAYRATEAGYKVGTQTEVDVLNALSTLVQAKTNYASSRYAYITSVVQLRFAAGTLDPNQVRRSTAG